jgi:hypothetical protein
MTECRFTDALAAACPAADRAGKMDLYGWLIGSWDLTQDSFRWRGQTSRNSGAIEAANWRLDLEFFARRVA